MVLDEGLEPFVIYPAFCLVLSRDGSVSTRVNCELSDLDQSDLEANGRRYFEASTSHDFYAKAAPMFCVEGEFGQKTNLPRFTFLFPDHTFVMTRVMPCDHPMNMTTRLTDLNSNRANCQMSATGPDQEVINDPDWDTFSVPSAAKSSWSLRPRPTLVGHFEPENVDCVEGKIRVQPNLPSPVLK